MTAYNCRQWPQIIIDFRQQKNTGHTNPLESYAYAYVNFYSYKGGKLINNQVKNKYNRAYY